MIPHLDLDETKKLELEAELKECNRILLGYHEMFKAATGLGKQSRFDFFKFVAQHDLGGPVSLGVGVTISAEDAKKIARVKEIEWQLIQAFSKMIAQIARKWHKRSFDKGIDLDDLESEALSAVVQSTVYFGSRERYSTFIYHCANRHLAEFCSRSKGILGVSGKARKVKKEYQELRLEEGSTFDSTVQRMGLSDREVRNLLSSLAKVCSDDALMSVSRQDEPKDNPPLRGILDSLELTDVEKAVLDEFMNSPTGRLGFASLSRTLINPKTNKPYTRMTFTYAWQRVKKKIQRACSKSHFYRAA